MGGRPEEQVSRKHVLTRQNSVNRAASNTTNSEVSLAFYAIQLFCS